MPRYCTEPVILMPGTRSFIRSRVFRKVDLPQPEGPMRAVTCFSGMSTLTFFSAWVGPYQRSRSRADRTIFSSIMGSPYFFFNFLPTSLALRLMIRVRSIRMAAMAKATSNSARSRAYTYSATVREAPEEWRKLSTEAK